MVTADYIAYPCTGTVTPVTVTVVTAVAAIVFLNGRVTVGKVLVIPASPNLGGHLFKIRIPVAAKLFRSTSSIVTVVMVVGPVTAMFPAT